MFRQIAAILMLLVLAVCSQAETDRAELVAKLQEYILQHRLSPEEYVISRFEDHDVVILGEKHRIRHDPLLVQSLIPKLYENGVYYLATEFARREDQPLIDSLLAGDTYDEKLARLITFYQFVHWSYQEYVDIFKAAWSLNHSLPPGKRRFRILALNESWDWSIFKNPGDDQVDSLRRLVFTGTEEEDWAGVILGEVSRGNKVIAYCGIHHGFSHFLQPKVEDGEFVRYVEERMGRYVYNELQDRVCTIYLHAPWNDSSGYGSQLVRPADGMIDVVMEGLKERLGPVGFDVVGTPFDSFEIKNAVYVHGHSNLTLGQFCDGYIYQKPFSQYEHVAVIEDFIDESMLEYARAQTPSPRYRDFTVQSYVEDKIIESENRQQSWRGL